MTESELNERLAELEQQRLAMLPPAPKRRGGRCYRRYQKRKKLNKLFIACTYDNKYICPICLHSAESRKPEIDVWQLYEKRVSKLPRGVYIHHANMPVFFRSFKRETNRRVRKNMIFPTKGNYYRLLYDMWSID